MKAPQNNPSPKKKAGLLQEIKPNQHGPALGPLSPKIQTAAGWKKSLIAQRKNLSKGAAA